jgi:hypothetical protein
MRQTAIMPLLIAAGTMLAGCDMTQRVVGAINPDTVSLADRCAAVMQLAMPASTDIEVTSRTSENAGITAIIARVAGVRRDLPKEAGQSPDIAVECRFDNTTMVGFHWTKGGPPPPPSAQ